MDASYYASACLAPVYKKFSRKSKSKFSGKKMTTSETVVVDALPYIDHGYDEPGVREAALAMVEEETRRLVLKIRNFVYIYSGIYDLIP